MNDLGWLFCIFTSALFFCIGLSYRPKNRKKLKHPGYCNDDRCQSCPHQHPLKQGIPKAQVIKR